MLACYEDKSSGSIRLYLKRSVIEHGKEKKTKSMEREKPTYTPSIKVDRNKLCMRVIVHALFSVQIFICNRPLLLRLVFNLLDAPHIMRYSHIIKMVNNSSQHNPVYYSI